MSTPVAITAYDLAARFIGTKEAAGVTDNPLVLAMLRLDQPWPERDEVPWCSAFVNFVCWLIRLPRSKSLAARSWLTVGIPIPLSAAQPGFDIVVLTRAGASRDPDAPGPGHVGFFAGLEADGTVLVLGGNQSNAVSLARFWSEDVLGVRRLVG